MSALKLYITVVVMFKVIMIKGIISDKITHFDSSDHDFCDNVIIPCVNVSLLFNGHHL